MVRKSPLAHLNPEQTRAVDTLEGPLLVLAGAGTGKTRVITRRIAHLLGHGIPPQQILAVTFTNKAAGEMRERVAELVGSKRAKELSVGTFHSFCLRVLRRNLDAIGMPRGFSICDASDQLSAVKGALRELRVPEAQLPARAVLGKISLLKNRLITADAFLDDAKDSEDELIGRAYRKVQERLHRSRSLDFDDLLVRTVDLLKSHPGILSGLQNRFRYLLVDEFQDTNAPQFEIVRRIAGERRNLCVVGDDDQSIYGWRGADVSKILDFGRHFNGAVVVRLETNYRSTEEILDAANRVIACNPARHEKVLRSHFGSGEPIRYVDADDEEREAETVVFDIVGKVQRAGIDRSSFAILFRTAPQARVFESLLRAHNIPYVLVGGMSFFDRKEVRDLLAFAKLAANSDDEVSFLRVVNTPPRGVGKSTIDRLLAFATKEGISVPAAIGRASEVPDLPAPALQSICDLRAALARIGSSDAPLVTRLRRMIAAVDYDTELVRCYPETMERETRGQAVVEFLNMAENYERRTAKPSLRGLLEEVALAAGDERPGDSNSKRDAVTLMTLHAAKGLEFPHVYLVGLEEGLLPHAKSVASDTIEEERRLAYVGVTRAQKRLTVSRAATRSRFGKRVHTIPSRFLFEMRGETPPEDWSPAGGPAKEAPPKAKRKGARRRGRPMPPGLKAAMQRKRRG